MAKLYCRNDRLIGKARDPLSQVETSWQSLMNAFCASVNFDVFMRIRSSPSQGFDAENSNQDRGHFRGSHHRADAFNLWEGYAAELSA